MDQANRKESYLAKAEEAQNERPAAKAIDRPEETSRLA